jgi:predicted nucleic acid-binding protein
VPVLTYVDAGVLIAAAKGEGDVSTLALSYLTDSLRSHVTSLFVRLEVLPKAVYHRNQAEIEFYESYFSNSAPGVEINNTLVEFALEHASTNGISGIDALHIVCAALAGAQEFITTEKPTKPIHRTRLITVISLFP